MRRRIFVWSAVGAVTLIGTRRLVRRRSPRTITRPVRAGCATPHDRPTLRLLPALVAYFGLVFGFSITGPWDAIVGTAKGVATAVKDWVVDLLTSIFDFLWDWAIQIVAWITQGFKDIWKFARDLNDWVVPFVGNLATLIWTKFGEAKDFAWSITQGLRGEVLGWLANIGHGIIDLAGFAAQIITDAYNLVAEKIYWPLWHMIQDVYRWVNDNVLAGIPNMIAGIVGALLGDVWTILRQAQSIIGWAWERGIGAVDLVWQAKDFLVFVITHPFTWWVDYLNKVIEGVPELIFRGVANAMDRNAPTMEDWILKAIGE